MSDLPQKSSEELAAELLKLMPEAKMAERVWKFWGHPPLAKIVIKTAHLILSQQQEIEQLNAELKELKQR